EDVVHQDRLIELDPFADVGDHPIVVVFRGIGRLITGIRDHLLHWPKSYQKARLLWLQAKVPAGGDEPQSITRLPLAQESGIGMPVPDGMSGILAIITPVDQYVGHVKGPTSPPGTVLEH